MRLMKTHTGSCHCGAVKYEVTADLNEGMRCNCSHCHRKGFILAFVPKSQVTIAQGEDTLTTYQFNKKIIDHRFCSTCSVQPFGHSGDMMAINLNTIDNLDLTTLPIKEVDGKNF